MFSIKAALQYPKLNLAAYRAALADSAKETIAESAFVWIDVATSIIPVWSGASRATFARLAQDVSFQLQLGNTPAAPDRTSLGLAQSDGGVEFDEQRGIFSFRYETTLDHLVFNEKKNANDGGDPAVFSRLLRPGPYNFHETANQAARSVFESLVIPDVRDFMTIVY